MNGKGTTPGKSAAWAAWATSAGITLAALAALSAACVEAPEKSTGKVENGTQNSSPARASRPTMIDSYGRTVRARCLPAPGSTSCVGVEYSPAPVTGSDGGDAGTGSSSVMGWGAPDFISAYNIPTLLPTKSVIGLIVASANPNLESDLEVYRSAYGLPSCTSASGCLTVVTGGGGTDFLAPDYNDIAESSLAVQVASAACPQCKLVVVVASRDPSRGPTMDELVAAANEAAKLKANVIATSYSAPELDQDGLPWAASYAKLLPATVYLFAPSGSSGFFDGSSPTAQVGVPAAFPNVTAVGGTTLTQVSESVSPRRWTESVWPLGGSGCSSSSAKPSFQQDTLCAKRTVADVAASADAALVYFTYVDPTDPTSYAGWHAEGGTGESATLVAAIFAATNRGFDGDPQYSYDNPVAFFDVTTGSNGSCPHDTALCNAQAGYDGPTGNGSPNGGVVEGNDLSVTPEYATIAANSYSGVVINTGAWAYSCDSIGWSVSGLPAGIGHSFVKNVLKGYMGPPSPPVINLELTAALDVQPQPSVLVQIAATCNGVIHTVSFFLDVLACQPITSCDYENDPDKQSYCGTQSDGCYGTISCPETCMPSYTYCVNNSCYCPPDVCPPSGPP